MTVQTTEVQTEVVADGIEVTFTFNFQSLDTSWVKASTIAPNGAETQRTDISVTLNADQEDNPGGTVTFDTAPVANDTVRMYRETPLTQLTDYTDYDAFPAESHEDALDKLTMISQETDSGGGGGTSNNFTSVLLNHTTDPATKGSYRLQYRDFVGSPVMFLEPTIATGDRSVIVSTSDGTTVSQFDFSRDGFFATPAIQVFTPGLSTEATRQDLIDDGGTITATFAPVSADKLNAYRFTTDSTTGLEIYAGFKTAGQGYGIDPVANEDFVTLDFFNNNTPGQGGIVNLINETNAEVLRINYDVIVSNVVTFTPVDASKTTFYNFYTDTTGGSEIVIAFKADGRIGLPTAPSDPEDAVRLQDLDGILDNPDLTGSIDFINQTIGSKKYTINVADIVGGNTFSLVPSVNNSGITFQTRSAGAVNFDFFLDNAGHLNLPDVAPLASSAVRRDWVEANTASLDAANTWTASNTFDVVLTSANGYQTAAAGAKFFDSIGNAVVAWNNVSMFSGNATQTIMYWNGNSRIRLNSTDISILGDDLNLNGNKIQNPGDPTAGTHVGDRDYNDNRYVQGGSWEVKIASIRYQNATPIGTQRGATAAKGVTGTWAVTLSSAASSADNIRCQITPIDGVIAHYTCGYTVNSSTSITVTLRNAGTTNLADGEFTLDVWDNG